MAPAAAIELWLSRHSGVALPAFAQTVRAVSHIAQSEASSAQDLSNVIANDAAMSARILQIANSSLFNPLGRKVDTISTAVVLLGFHAVRDLAVSISVLDNMRRGSLHARLSAAMATACHAATQARSLARATEVANVEQVFVATLLKEVGRMAFWSRVDEQSGHLESALMSGEEAAAAERRLLGFTLDALSGHLARHWSLGDLSSRLHDPKRRTDHEVRCVTVAHELARAVESGAGLKAAVKAAAREFGLSESWLASVVEENVSAARSIAKQFGIDIEALHSELTPPPAQAPNSDFLDRISEGLENGMGRDDLMRLLVEGTADALGASQCYFLLLAPDRQSMSARFLASRCNGPRSGQQLALSAEPLLAEALRERRATARRAPARAPWHHQGNALLYGVHIGGKPVGVFYCERLPEPKEPEQSLFRKASQQIALILTQAE